MKIAWKLLTISKIGSKPGVQYDCPTGNCTYAPFHTLAFDFECVDMPIETLVFDCKNTSAEWQSTVAYEGPGLSPNVTSCGWYLDVPDSLPQLMSGYEVRENGSIGEVLATRMFPFSDIWNNQQFFGGSIM